MSSEDLNRIKSCVKHVTCFAGGYVATNAVLIAAFCQGRKYEILTPLVSRFIADQNTYGHMFHAGSVLLASIAAIMIVENFSKDVFNIPH